MKAKKQNNCPLVVWSVLISVIGSGILYLHIFDSYCQLWIVPCLIIIFPSLLILLIGRMANISIELKKRSIANKWVIFAITFLIVMAGQGMYLLAYYPGGFNLDAYGQWDQVHGLQHLNDWHPILTTLWYGILTKIFDSVAFCVVSQIGMFAFAVSYLLSDMHKYFSNTKTTIATAILVALNPAIGMNNVCLIKDVPFAICAVWAFWMTFQMYISEGKWILKIKNTVTLVLVSIAILMIRHNGVFLLLPMLLAWLMVYRRQGKHLTATFAVIVGIFLFIKGPVFNYFQVEKHSNVIGEVVGVPMSIMVNSYVNDYNNTSNDVKAFLEEIASYKEWKDRYIVGEWDSCKWEFGGIELLKGTKLSEIIMLSLKTAQSCPQTAYQSIRENTRVVWQTVGHVYWNPWVYIEENDYGIEKKPVYIMFYFEQNIERISNTLLGTTLTWSIGFIILIFLMFTGIAFAKRNYKVISFGIPIVIYDLLTMLLLCGPNFRYFYFNCILVLPFVMIVLLEEAKHDGLYITRASD